MAERHALNASFTGKKKKTHEYFIKHRPFPSMLLSGQQETLWLQWMQIVDIAGPMKSFLHAKILHGVFQANYLKVSRKIHDIWKKNIKRLFFWDITKFRHNTWIYDPHSWYLLLHLQACPEIKSLQHPCPLACYPTEVWRYYTVRLHRPQWIKMDK